MPVVKMIFEGIEVLAMYQVHLLRLCFKKLANFFSNIQFISYIQNYLLHLKFAGSVRDSGA